MVASWEMGNYGSILGGVIVGGGYDVVSLGRDRFLGVEQLALEGLGGLLLQVESGDTLMSMLLQSFVSIGQGG
jgi:hypothetical protein